jgi:class 3 adenylate cyclase
VAESAAAVWEYGGKCGSADRQARLDEYAWRMADIDAAVQLSGFLGDTSYFDQLGTELRSQVQELEREAVLVRTLPVEANDKKQYVAEIIGQDGTDIVYLRMTTAQELTGDDYLGMARQVLDRMREASDAG